LLTYPEADLTYYFLFLITVKRAFSDL